nr:hypothetical protein [Streptomyces ureilyticus]
MSPAHEAGFRAEENREMSPTSARMISAVSTPTPSSAVSTLTRGSVFAVSISVASARSMTCWSASMVSSRSPTTCREAAGSGSRSSQARPMALQALRATTTPVAAVMGQYRVDPVAQHGAHPTPAVLGQVAGEAVWWRKRARGAPVSQGRPGRAGRAGGQW